jgi:Raf kinase inhibitor-like YbhB/YbcL family protein
VRTQLFTIALASTLFACGDDGGGSQDTGSSGPGESGDDSPTMTEPVTMTADDDSGSTSPTGPGTSSSDDGSGTTSADTSGSSGADESSSSTSEPVEFALFSDAFLEGEGIPPIHHVSGGNESPPLNWVGTPAGTMSLAIFFYDISIDFEHSAIWNIPADVTELPQDVDQVALPPDVPGAVQCRSWIDEFGYGGPGSAANFYEFTIYAIDVEQIPEAEIDEESDLEDVRAAFMAHAIASTTLTGQSTGPN